MSTPSQKHKEDQEIDLVEVSKKISGFFNQFAAWIFRCILFVKKNIIIIGILFLGGIALGTYMDRHNKIYDHQIIVAPNFNSVDYLYAKIKLIDSKIIEGDNNFLKNVVGIKNPQNFKRIRIEPIPDIYRFVGERTTNFDFIKLLGEAGDMNQIVKDDLTSRNYLLHNISFTTSATAKNEDVVAPLMVYLNNSEYFDKVKKEYISNTKTKIKQTDSVITQIDRVLNSFSKNTNGNQTNDKLVYYNENTQLNDVIKTKNELIDELGYKRLDLITKDYTIKEISTAINIKNTKFFNTHMNYFLPVLFVFVFIVLMTIRSFYRSQLHKSKQ